MAAPSASNMHRMHVFLPPTTKRQVAKLAKQQGIPLSELVRRAVQEYIEKSAK